MGMLLFVLVTGVFFGGLYLYLQHHLTEEELVLNVEGDDDGFSQHEVFQQQEELNSFLNSIVQEKNNLYGGEMSTELLDEEKVVFEETDDDWDTDEFEEDEIEVGYQSLDMHDDDLEMNHNLGWDPHDPYTNPGTDYVVDLYYHHIIDDPADSLLDNDLNHSDFGMDSYHDDFHY